MSSDLVYVLLDYELYEGYYLYGVYADAGSAAEAIRTADVRLTEPYVIPVEMGAAARFYKYEDALGEN